MVAINEIFVESAKLLVESVFEVESGTIMSTGNTSLGYNVVDTRLRPTDPNYIVRTFDNAQAAQNYNNTINLEIRRNSSFDPRASGSPAPNNTIPTTTNKPPLEWDDLKDRNGRLPRSIQAQLRRDGFIEHGGHRYTRQEIEAFTQQANARRAQIARDVEAQRGKLLTMDEEAKRNPRRWARNNISFLRQATSSTMRSLFPFTFRPGVSMAAYDTLKDMLINMYASVNDQTSAEDFEVASRQLFGAWFITFAVPDLIGALRAGTRLLFASLVKIFRAANMANMTASQLAAWVGGLPGQALMAFKNLLQFIAVEAAIYFAIRAATSNQDVQKAIMGFIAKDYVNQLALWGYTGAEFVDDLITEQWNSKVVPQFGDTVGEMERVDAIERLGLEFEKEFGQATSASGDEIEAGGPAQPIQLNPQNNNTERRTFNLDDF